MSVSRSSTRRWERRLLSVATATLVLLLSFVVPNITYSQSDDDQLKLIDIQGNLTLWSNYEAELVLRVAGRIEASTVRDFLNLARNRSIQRIELDSPGGDLEAGVTLAELVALQSFETYIAPGSSCASACSLVFFAGDKRTLLGRVGVHQYRTSRGTPDDESEAQERVGRLIELLNSFAVPNIVIEKMTLTNPSCIYWFGPEHRGLFERSIGNLNNRAEGLLDCGDGNRDDSGNSPLVDQKERPIIQFAPSNWSVAEAQAIQLSLGLTNNYDGMQDGVFGPRSRRALEEFKEQRGLSSDSNLAALTSLAEILSTEIARSGWEYSDHHGIGVSYLFPTDAHTRLSGTFGFGVAYSHNFSSLIQVIGVPSRDQVRTLHGYLDDRHAGRYTNFTIRRSNLWITHSLIDGESYYLRSQLTNRGWSSLMTLVRPGDEGYYWASVGSFAIERTWLLNDLPTK